MWSVAVSRVVLACLALYTVTTLTWAFSTVDGTWRATGGGLGLLALWTVLDVTVRTDPGWRAVRRRTRAAGRPRDPGLATTAVAALTGASAGTTAVLSAFLLAGRAPMPLPLPLQPLTYELAAFALLCVVVLLAGSPDAAAPTAAAAVASGAAAGFVVITVAPFEHGTLETLIAWPLAMLAVAVVAVLGPVDRFRTWAAGLVPRRQRARRAPVQPRT